MLSPALFVMYTRTVSADAENVANASKSQQYLKPIREHIAVLELMAVLLFSVGRVSLGVGASTGQAGILVLRPLIALALLSWAVVVVPGACYKDEVVGHKIRNPVPGVSSAEIATELI